MTTVDHTSTDDQPATRRQILALLALRALADLPTPQRVSFIEDQITAFEPLPKVRLRFERIADGVAWAEHYKVKYRTYVQDGETCLLEERIVESGWVLSLIAGEPVDPPLDEDTRARLAAVTGGAS